MRIYRTILFLSLISAGGKPLAPDLNPIVLTSEQQLLLESQQAIEKGELGVKIDADMRPLQDTLEEMARQDEPLDPEYLAILEELEDRKNHHLYHHRDTQWKAVAQAMRHISVQDRIELIESVRKFPLYRRMPASAAIQVRALGHWNIARSIFLNAIKQTK